ncbi:MAG TPA: 5-formyltetrahydrofolate cyclo-ligase [Rhodanobacteraceae bacterium]|jgi:5-formyltetrahydrofolate cyclo-ligase|nr:5-formyltetrahydrofolate cyclo-ligase [Rhodanobacteraceae bacterium]
MTSPADAARTALRTTLRERRTAISTADRIAATMSLVAHLEAIPEFLTDTNIAGYWAIAGELPLAAIIGGLRARGQAYHLPVIDANKRLTFAAWWPGMEITPNRLGIPEPGDTDASLAPDALDVVLVPLLGFDRRGHRLGFGGGYYDRSFAFLRDVERPAKPLLVGIGYALQEVERVPPEDWDVPLDYIATERELIDFTNPET